MKSSHNKACSVMKINFRFLLPAYIVTAAFFVVGIYNIISCLTGLTDNYYVDMANYLYTLAVVAPIIIVARNFKKIMHLNGAKTHFYWGALLNYGMIASSVSLLCILFFAATKTLFGSRLIVLNLADVFGWWKHGVIIAFIQQFCFLLLVQAFLHTLTSIQNRWYGWITDGLLAVILCVFIPLPELRRFLINFFDMIIFNSNAMVQIASCLVLSSVFYMLYLLELRRKEL